MRPLQRLAKRTISKLATTDILLRHLHGLPSIPELSGPPRPSPALQPLRDLEAASPLPVVEAFDWRAALARLEGGEQ